MTEIYFVDTNVLVYARDTRESSKQKIAEKILAQLWTEGTGRISVQVLCEYYSVLTGKFKVSPDIVIAEVRDLRLWQPVTVCPEDLETAHNLKTRHSLSWWDSLIITSAIKSRANILLSEDLQDSSVYDSIRVINPFMGELG